MASALPQLPASLRFASVRIQYDGAPDSLMGQVESREQQGRLVVSSSLVNEGDGRAGAGAHPWQVDHGTNSFLFLTNMGDKPSRIGFQVQAKGVDYYLTNLKLQPHETRAIGMRELRDQQQEDFRKNKIPADATEGTVRWVRLDNVPVMGRLVRLSSQNHVIVSLDKRARGTANGGAQAPLIPVNFICQDCFCPCPASLQNLDYSVGCDVLNVISGQICGISFLGDYVDCNGNSSFFDDTLSSSVSSSDTSIATIANSADPASLTGLGPGTADVTASFADNSYPFAPNSCSPQLYTVSTIISVNVKRLQILDISPNIALAGAISVPLTITGTGFGVSVSPNLPSGVTLQSINVRSSTRIDLTVDVSIGASIGAKNLSLDSNGVLSNSVAFTIDGPSYMVVQDDALGYCPGCTTAVERTVTYQVMNFSNTQATGHISIGETFSVTNWNCNQGFPGIITTPCGSGGQTDFSGLFQDAWSIGSDVYSPVGCGDKVSDIWLWCPQQPHSIGTLTGYIHTNSISINGYVSPPPSTLPTGLVIR